MLRHLFVSAAIAALLIGGQACGAATSNYPAPTWDGDKDRDGVLDAKEAKPECVDTPEDFDGYKDDDGCIDPDNDDDGIEDVDDACPNVKGESPSGCPGIAQATETAKMRPGDLDKDGDGIIANRDRCPDQAEDFDGRADDDGCPEDDVDDDGVLDGADKCDREKEDGLGANKTDGCPMVDTDGDKIEDRDDKCRTLAGKPDNDGCPLCVANWTGDATISVTSTSGLTCASVAISPPGQGMTCSGAIRNCSTSNDELSGAFSCQYDKISASVSGSIQISCKTTTAEATVRTSDGSTLKFSLRKR